MAIGLIRFGLSKSDLLSLNMNEFIEMNEEYSRIQERNDFWNASLCTYMVNSYSKKQYKVDDFMPSDGKEEKAQTPEDMLAILQQFV